MKDRIRIKDIAATAGVSTGTVDRVLHKRGNVSKALEERVLKALETLDYSPNVLASVLAYNKKWKIAVLIPNTKKDLFWNQPKQGILNALSIVKDYGITVDFFHFIENQEADFIEKSQDILKEDYNCVIVAPIFKDQSIIFLKQCDTKNIQYVLINTYLDIISDNLLCYIGQDSYRSGILGAKLLAFGLESGSSVLICHLEEMAQNPQHLIDKELGFNTYFNSHQELSIEVVSANINNLDDNKGMSQVLSNLLSDNPNIKGIFVSNSRAFHIVDALKKLERTDIKLVGFDLVDANLENLNSDKIDFLINQNPFKQGYLAIINIFNFLIRKISPSKLQHLPLDIVMKENVTYYSDQLIEEIPFVI